MYLKTSKLNISLVLLFVGLISTSCSFPAGSQILVTGTTLAGDVITFQFLGSADGYFWAFGDGGTGSGNPVTHIFSAPGTYTVEVIISVAGGPVLTFTTTITIIAPPTFGQIAYVSDENGNKDIFLMDEDGTNKTQCTNDAAADVSPRWSPDGTRIAYLSLTGGHFELFVMNSNCTGQVQLTTTTDNISRIAWSPNGSQIAFTRAQNIWRINAVGSGETQLTSGGNFDNGTYSADGTKILHNSSSRILVMNSDGSSQTPLESCGQSEIGTWNPTGTKIAYACGPSFNQPYDIRTMNPDGSSNTILSALNASMSGSGALAWSPDGTMIAFTTNPDHGGSEAGNLGVVSYPGGTKVILDSGVNALARQLQSFQEEVWKGNEKIVYAHKEVSGKFDIYVVYSDGTGKTNVTNSSADESEPVFSPAP